MRDLTLTFFTRPGCHLCDDARPLVTAETLRIGARLHEIDIDSDDRLVALYGLRIPVLVGPDERVVAEGVINDRKRLRRALREL